MSVEPITIDGTTYVHAVRLNYEVFEPFSAEYNLERKYQRFTAKVGFSDTAEAAGDAEWHFTTESISDGNVNVLSDVILKAGQVRVINVAVGGVARFVLLVRLSGQEPLSGAPATDYSAAWVNPTLVP